MQLLLKHGFLAFSTFARYLCAMHASLCLATDLARIRGFRIIWDSLAAGSRRRMMSVACALALTAGGQAHAAERTLFEVSGGPFDLSGFRDAQTREMVIPLRFEVVRLFSEGLAAVRDKGLWGYIDRTGAWVITPRFEIAGDFHNGLAKIQAGKRVGAIDRTGKIVIEPQFENIEPFTSDIVMATEGEAKHDGNEHNRGHFVGGFSSSNRKRLYQVGRGWITGAWLKIETFDPQRGLFWAKGEDEELWGIMRLDGSWFMEPRYNRPVHQLRDGLAFVHAVEKKILQPDIFLMGAIDAEGKVVIPLRSWYIQHRRGEPFYRVREKDGRVGLVDRNGQLAGGRLFDEMKPTSKGYALRNGDTWTFVSDEGKLSPLTEEAHDEKVGNSDLIKRRVAEGKYRVIGPDGAPTTPETFDEVANFGASPWAARITDAGDTRWGFLDAHGRPIGTGFVFEMVSGFVEDRALVKVHQKWGLIDPSGRFVVNPIYDYLLPAGHFRADSSLGLVSPGPRTERARATGWQLFVGVKDKRAIALDRDGVEQPLAPEDDPTIPRPAASRLERKGGLRFATVDGLWGMTDRDGKWIIPPRYRALHEFRYGVAWAPIDDKRRWCPVGPDGAVRDNPNCVEARHPLNMSHHEPEKLSDDRFESSVLWSRAHLEFLAGLRQEAPK